MGKKTINSEKILADIKARARDATLMEKYNLSGKESARPFQEARGCGGVEKI